MTIALIALPVAIAAAWAVSRYYAQIVTIQFPSSGPVARWAHLGSAAGGVEFEWVSSRKLQGNADQRWAIRFRHDRLGARYYFNSLPHGRLGFVARTHEYDVYDQEETGIGAGVAPAPPRDRMYHLVLRVPYWGLLVAAVAAAAWSWQRRRRRRGVPGRCAGCGYDLRATPDRCPECGNVANGNGRSTAAAVIACDAAAESGPK